MLKAPQLHYLSPQGIEYTQRTNISLRERDTQTLKETGATITEALADITPPVEEFENVLELGCGIGHNLALLQQKFPLKKFTGLDIQTNALQIGASNYPNIQFVEGIADDFLKGELFFDFIFTRAFLIHIVPQDISSLISEISRKCKYFGAIEYFSKDLEAINWRGIDGVVWKQDFLSLFKLIIPNCSVVSEKLVPIKRSFYEKNNLYYKHFLVKF